MDKPIFNQLEAAQDETVQLLSSFSQKDINKVPFEGSWTAARVGQHLFLAGNNIDKLLHTPAPAATRNPEERAANLKEIFLNFETKFQSPDFIFPEDKIYDKEKMVDSLREISNKLLAAAKTSNLNEIAALPEGHPLQGGTKLEIVHFVTYHTTRHNNQIRNILYRIKD